MADQPFGWTEALLNELTPQEPREHSPHYGCPCDTCTKVRDDIRRYGFNPEGKIAYPRIRPALPWEQERIAA